MAYQENKKKKKKKKKKSNNYCSVYGYKSFYLTNECISFHRLPNLNEPKILWKNSFGIEELVNRRRIWSVKLKLSEEALTKKQLQVCSKHSTPNDYLPGFNRIRQCLRPFEVPSVNLPKSSVILSSTKKRSSPKKMPIIKVSDKEKLKLIKVIDSCKTLSCAFRTWDLNEYPILPRNTSHSWTVKSSNLLEKPRFVLFGLQTDRKRNIETDAGRFDHCQLKNLKVHLNSEVYPYEDFRADFKNNTTSILYKAHTDFQKSYYEKEYSEPLLSKHIFQNYSPIIVVDLSCQNDNVKSSTVDLRIEFETDTIIPAKTTAYCLILHDQIITYSPFSGEVRKL